MKRQKYFPTFFLRKKKVISIFILKYLKGNLSFFSHERKSVGCFDDILWVSKLEIIESYERFWQKCKSSKKKLQDMEFHKPFTNNAEQKYIFSLFISCTRTTRTRTLRKMKENEEKRQRYIFLGKHEMKMGRFLITVPSKRASSKP